MEQLGCPVYKDKELECGKVKEGQRVFLNLETRFLKQILLKSKKKNRAKWVKVRVRWVR